MSRFLLILLAILSLAPTAFAQQSSAPQRTYEVWRLPNGYEEYYMLLALATYDRQWCDRISMEAQIRKPEARKGVQAVGWRSICMMEVAAASQNPETCSFVRGAYSGTLDGREFNQNYCLSYMQNNVNLSREVAYEPDLKANHWLASDPYKPKFLNSQSILRAVGFTEKDLVEEKTQGLYQNITQLSWDEFLLRKMLGPPFVSGALRKKEMDKYDRLVKRSIYLPDFANQQRPADRFLRYTGTPVKLPANCYENPTSEFSCRMLECLNVRDLWTCRSMAGTQEIKDLYGLFVKKCADKSGAFDDLACRKQINEPFNKIFNGPAETFLPYLNR